MITLIRHLLAIAALPFVVAVLAPAWVARRSGATPALGTTAAQRPAAALRCGL
jgi:hypothetical protein